ncbi:hypothetical protein HWB39_gp17 [Streptomyces phage WRightOn]|jgi:hypothetical protein|uniref:Uncharacterized protein n=4 Tax=Caudoviricetes TaxID=2731619 RepID=A0A2H4PI89_9CAUD|nr:hypothetical protein HWB39_gp17 [Streptomyces phage WRightOn]YP_009856777.1 hypothetical protein HWD10_gp53 [Streptomyces phage JXY1]QNN99003.1 hypothetical protein SEA_ZEIGLE_82 [Streptomyces phage Zeigle]WNA15489.1 hypothetical protein SEA_KUMQUAT_82 [Streptomyces phage Kumquat]ATW62519.1 hypothetical protein SEA_WRIGHTON_86 [Streptomyces phage WRightOn]QIA28824.1 hypothetical protein [Streptomyces phage JXY1]
MPKWLHTFSSNSGDGEGKKKAEQDVTKAAKLLTNQGKGKTHYAKLEKRAGDWQVNIYER